MKRFLKYCVLFLMPIAISLILLELLVGFIPNSYSYKYNYVKNNGGQIQALAIGHSQLYDGFKPESCCLPSFNLCNSSQSYIDNYYLLLELLPYMPNLKVVIIPIGYIDVELTTNYRGLTDRSCYYHKYMNLNYNGQLPLKYWFECLDPLKAGEKCFLYFVKHTDMIGCDSMGRRNTHYLRNRQHALGYENQIENFSHKEHDYRNFCLQDGDYLTKTLRILNEKNISAVLVSPPYYWDCGSKKVNHEQKKYLQYCIQKLSKEYRFKYVNMETDSTFHDEDFYNETHLSEYGAEKFTQKLNSFLRVVLY